MAADTLKTRLLPVEQVKKWIRLDSILLGRDVSDMDEVSLDAIREFAPELVPGADTLDTEDGGVPPDSLPVMPDEAAIVDTLPPDSLPQPVHIPADSVRRPVGLIKDGFKLKGAEEEEPEQELTEKEKRRQERQQARAERRKRREERRQKRLERREQRRAEREKQKAERRKQQEERDAEEREQEEDETAQDPKQDLQDTLPDLALDTISAPQQAFEQGIDSLFPGLDSLRAEQPLQEDTASRPDSARVLFAYKHVRIFKSDVQAIADSVVFTTIDSLIRCYHDPVIWSDGSQIAGEYMTIALKDKKIDDARVYRRALMISEVDIDSTKYNQMSGKNMVGTFREGELTELLVEGNARTIYYVPEDSVSLMGVNYAENSSTLMFFKDGELDVVKLMKDVDQTTYPLWDEEAKTRLDGFYLREPERPKDRDDIFRKAERTPRPARDPSEPEDLQATELEELMPEEEPEPAEEEPGEEEESETETGEPGQPAPIPPGSGQPFEP